MSQVPPPPPDHRQQGQPETTPPPAPGIATDPHPGRTVIASSRALMRQDRSLFLVILIGGFCSLLAAGPLVLAQILTAGQPTNQYATYAVSALSVFVGTTITTFFAVALAAGASARMDGDDPTISSCLGTAWRNLSAIVKWGLFAATIGLILRVIESRLSGLASLIVRVLGDTAFAAASYFVVPLLVQEKVGPIEALKQSASVVSGQWRKAVRFNLRLGAWVALVYVVVGGLMVAAIISFASITSGDDATNLDLLRGVALLVASVTLLVWSFFYIYAISIYGRTALYRYATGRPVPGFSTVALQGAARESRVRRWMQRR